MTETRNLVLGTAGHIDHGKTALVRALTGVNTDRLPAEKLRGITVDLGFAALDLPGHRLGMVDVPGHERFVRNMLAGASGMDLALLVVAADDSVMPQTREHLEILNLLGLAGGLIVLTKIDLVDPSWLDLVEDDVRRLVAGTFLDNAPILRTSTVTGEGIERVKEALLDLAASVPETMDLGPFRMAIDRSFTRAGLGTIVTGTVASGIARLGDELDWMPEGRTVRVRGLQRHDESVEFVGRGARAAINLGGVHHTEIVRGQELATPGYLHPTRVLTVSLTVSVDAPRPVKHRGRYRVHLGTADVAATLALLGTNALKPGETGLGQLLLAEPAVALAHEPFILREESPPATLGGGKILQTSAGRIRRKDVSAISRLQGLQCSDPVERVTESLASFGLGIWTELTLCRESAVPLDMLKPILDDLGRSGAVVDLPVGSRRTTRLTADVVADLEDRVERALGRLHLANPRQTAVRRSHVLAALPDLPGEAMVSGLLDRLVARGAVVSDNRSVALKSFEPRLSQSERKLKAELLKELQAGGFSPPDAADLAKTAGARAAVVPELLALLVEEGRIVLLGAGLYLDVDAELRLRCEVTAWLEQETTMTMADLRDLLKTSRKYAVPIGEYLDRIRLTRREGDLRRLESQTQGTLADHA